MSPRIKAFLIHLAISLCILAVLLVIIYKIWFPQPFFSGDGGWQGVRIIAGVDIILGPLITLVVFNIKKPWKELRRDMSIIALIQFTALSAGLWIVYQQRTQLILFTEHHLTSLSKFQIESADIPPTLLKQLLVQNPPIAYVALPTDLETSNDQAARHSTINALRSRGELYELLNSANRQRMLKSGLGLAFVSEILPDKKPVIDKFLDKYKTSQGSYVMIPIIMRYKELSLVFNKNSGDLMGTLPITLQNLLPILTKIRNTRS